MESEKSTAELIEECKYILTKHWNDINKIEMNKNFLAGEKAEAIRNLLRCKTKTYRYVLPTQILAKTTNHSFDCRCVQVGREPVQGNFDARSINEKVVIPFERENKNPLGGSSQPYVNNPLRVPEITDRFAYKQKNQKDWNLLATILEEVEEKNDQKYTLSFLKQVLLEIRRIQNEQEISYPVPHRISLEDTLNLLNDFLLSSSGGGRLQATVFSLFLTLKDVWGIYEEVLSESVNAPDTQAGRPADIDCLKEGKTVIAVEVKDRTVTLELLEDKISLSRLKEVRELLFLIRSKQLVADDAAAEKGKKEFGSGLNVYILDFSEFTKSVLVLIGEKGRHRFLLNVGHSLEQLKVDFKDRKEWAELLNKY